MSAQKEASLEAQAELQNILHNKATVVSLSTGRKVKIGYLLPDAQDKIDDLIVEHDTIARKVKSGEVTQEQGNKTTRQLYAKVLAAAVLNTPFSIRLWWGIKWRIIYRYWRLDGTDYLNLIAEIKKKVVEQQQPLYLAMALVMTMSDTVKTMTTKEAEAFRQELNSVKEHPQ